MKIFDSESDDTFSVFNTLSDFEEESNGDSKNVARPSEHGSYFPSEICFLLHSYLHNVSRPKVFFLILIFTNAFSHTGLSFCLLYTRKIHSFFIDKDLQVCVRVMLCAISHI